jgi:hypothetical protein
MLCWSWMGIKILGYDVVVPPKDKFALDKSNFCMLVENMLV